MEKYKEDEIVEFTELGESLEKYVDKVISNRLNKIVITRNDKPEAVMIPIAEYEHIRVISDIYEDMQIAKVIKERVTNKEELAKIFSQEEFFEVIEKDK